MRHPYETGTDGVTLVDTIIGLQIPAFWVGSTANQVAELNSELVSLLNALRTKGDQNRFDDLLVALNSTIHNFTIDE